jgi:uncharacterized protein YciI
MTGMFVAVSTYTRPLEEIDAVRGEHLEWIGRQYQSGQLLVSGRQSPAVGGVVIGRAGDLAAFRTLLADDPFVRTGLARYDVIEFEPTPAALATPGFAAFVGSQS